MSTILAACPRAICRFISTFSLLASVIGLSYQKVCQHDEPRIIFKFYCIVVIVVDGLAVSAQGN
ncbi:hypothetical protein BD769DRAFT_1427549 [Suillus cothurnatus]|nr:hypothetical protein BD769DRAFT_1427549 [Suillus cothurnatus]